MSVISAPPSARLLVEAGPGTGKTDTLVARLKYLVDSGGLSPSRVLVLSFSVDAVKELKARIERARMGGDTKIAFIDIRTFDSSQADSSVGLLPLTNSRNSVMMNVFFARSTSYRPTRPLPLLRLNSSTFSSMRCRILSAFAQTLLWSCTFRPAGLYSIR